MALKTDNQTLWSQEQVGCDDAKMANFEYFPTRKGMSFHIFRGRMLSENGVEKAVVKLLRNSKGSRENLKAYLDTSKICHSLLTEFHGRDQKHKIKFKECHLALMDNVSSFNRIFRQIKPYAKIIKKDEYVVMEPYIPGKFESFIGKNGLVFGDCPSTLEEFAHFSFHFSGGEYLVTGLQGVKSNHVYNLTTPRIHSRNSNTYGWNDLGEEGMRTFFKTHRCTPRCENWRRYTESPDYVDDNAFDIRYSEPFLNVISYDDPPDYWSLFS